jgi:DNA-entry nuclease
MFKNANTPVMRGFEKQIADAVRGGQVVRYQVTPIYKGSDKIARGITMKAYGSGKNPLNLHVTVLNIPKP